MHKQVIETYLDGFRSGNTAKVLQTLTEDVVWRLYGCQTFEGKAAYAANIENDEFVPLAHLEVHELIESGDRVVATGSGALANLFGDTKQFNFCEIFTLRDGLISLVETYQIWNE